VHCFAGLGILARSDSPLLFWDYLANISAIVSRKAESQIL